MPAPPWFNLFGPPPGQKADLQITMRLLRKHGRPLLLLPSQATAAATCLDLYPAQTGRARAVRSLLRMLYKAGWMLKTEKLLMPWWRESRLAKFIKSAGGVVDQGPPVMGILGGNPAHDTQRFLILVFDEQQRPVAVVKTGLSGPARKLVRMETAFLGSVPANTPGIPARLAVLESDEADAFAMNFFPGDSPAGNQAKGMAEILGSWISASNKIRITEMAEWQALQAAAIGNERLKSVVERLRDKPVCSAIQHGDFTPWNIKVCPQGKWTVLDWERGRLRGLPGWDWFHYVIQTAVSVHRAPVRGLVGLVEDMISSEAFQKYAGQAAILGLERDLVIAYLLHIVEIIKPAEGLEANSELLKALAGGRP